MLTDKEYASMIAAIPVNTWSAMEPPYKFTEMCPDEGCRPLCRMIEEQKRREDADGAD